MDVVLGMLATSAVAILAVLAAQPRSTPRRVDRSLWLALEPSPDLTPCATLDGLPELLWIERTPDGTASVVWNGGLFGRRHEIARQTSGLPRLPRVGHDGRLLWVADELEQRHRGTASRFATGGPLEGLLSVDPTRARVAYRRVMAGSRGEVGVHDLDTDRTITLGVPVDSADVVAADVSWSDASVLLAVRRRDRTWWPTELWRVPVEGGDARHVANVGKVGSVRLSPDGASALVASRGVDPHTLRLDLADGSMVRLSVWLDAPVWSPDGHLIAGIAEGPSVWVVDLRSGRSTRLVELARPIPGGAPGAIEPVRAPVFSPDGRFVAFWLRRRDEGTVTVAMGIVDLAARRLWVSRRPIEDLAWSRAAEGTAPTTAST